MSYTPDGLDDCRGQKLITELQCDPKAEILYTVCLMDPKSLRERNLVVLLTNY